MKTRKFTSTLAVLAVATLACNLQAAGSTPTATPDQSLLTQTATTSTPSSTALAEASSTSVPSTETSTPTLVLPTPTDTPLPPLPNWTIFKQGDTGHEVTALQYLLNFAGQNLVVDGNFGPKTKDAVKDFQTSKGLAADGIVGAETWTALIQGAQIHSGSHGDAVKAAQSLLRGRFHYGITVDGNFGPETDSAVRDLQGSHYVDVDGIVGPDTWQVLIGKYPN